MDESEITKKRELAGTLRGVSPRGCYTRVEDETPYATWDYEKERVAGTLQSFCRTVAKIENHQFSNAKVRKCARLCDGCDMRFYCVCK